MKNVYKITWVSGFTPIEDVINSYELINNVYYCKGTFTIGERQTLFTLKINKKNVLKIEKIK